MRRSTSALVPACVLALQISAASAAEDLMGDAQDAATRWDIAYNAGDMDTLAKLYTDDAVVVTKGGPRTRAGIPEFFAGLKSKGWEDHKTTVASVVPRENVVVVSGRWEMTGPSDGGARTTFRGNWVNVLERRGDGWRTVLHTWN